MYNEQLQAEWRKSGFNDYPSFLERKIFALKNGLDATDIQQPQGEILPRRPFCCDKEVHVGLTEHGRFMFVCTVCGKKTSPAW